MPPLEQQHRQVHKPHPKAVNRVAPSMPVRTDRPAVQGRQHPDDRPQKSLVQPRQLHSDRTVQPFPDPACIVADKDTGGEGGVVQRVLDFRVQSEESQNGAVIRRGTHDADNAVDCQETGPAQTSACRAGSHQ